MPEHLGTPTVWPSFWAKSWVSSQTSFAWAVGELCELKVGSEHIKREHDAGLHQCLHHKPSSLEFNLWLVAII